MQQLEIYSRRYIYDYNERQHKTLWKPLEYYSLDDEDVKIFRYFIDLDQTFEDFKRIYFVPGTKFKREFIKNKSTYKITLTKSPETADIIIYNPENISISDHINYMIDNPSGNKYTYAWCRSNITKGNYWLSHKYEVPIVNKLIELYNDGYRNFMTIDKLYSIINPKIDNEAVNKEFVTKILNQLSSTDTTVIILALETLFSIDTEKYLDVIRLILMISQNLSYLRFNSVIIQNFIQIYPKIWMTRSQYTPIITTPKIERITSLTHDCNVPTPNTELLLFIFEYWFDKNKQTITTKYGKIELRPQFVEEQKTTATNWTL